MANNGQDNKLFYTIGEVAKMLNVETSTVRFWENEFTILKPQRNAKGNRLFRAEDVKNIKIIYHLVKERGMTLEGAKKMIKDTREDTTKDTEIVERLKSIRALLVEMSDNLGE